jgi:hypothetical protein
MSNLLEKASIITTPTAYSDGVLHSVKPEQTLGSELIINGDFATDSNWNKNTGWSISNNTAISDGSNTSGSIISQTIQLVNGKTYQVTVDVNSVDSGRVRFYSNYLGSGGQADITSSGTFTYNVTSIITGGRTVGIQARDAGTQAVINSISVKELINADFTFTRNSPATRVNPQGLVQSVQILGSNVVTNGDFATNADWTAGDGWSFGGNKASCDGTQTNVTNLIQTISTNIQNQLVKISFTLDISAGTLSGSLNNSGGTEFDALTISGNYFVEATSGDINPTILFQGDANFIGSISNVVIEPVTDDTDLPRIDYRGGCGSLLLEPQAINTATDSNDFTTGDIFVESNNPSLSFSILTSAQATSPDGTNNAWKLVDNNDGNSGGCHIGYFSTNVISENYNTVSLFVKKQGNNDWVSIDTRSFDATSESWFNISNGTLVNVESGHTASIDDYGNGWYRIAVTFITEFDLAGSVLIRLATSNGENNILRDGTNGAYIYGLQAESDATRQYATSYIPTSGDIQTRGADLAGKAGSSDLIDSTEGVFYAEFKSIAEFVDVSSSISINNSTAQSRFNIYKLDSSNILKVQLRPQNNSPILSYNSTLTNVDFDKVAIKWKSGDYAIWINGVEVAVSTSTILPIGLNRVDFNGYTTTFQPFQGNVKCVAVFKEALTDAELTALTTI